MILIYRSLRVSRNVLPKYISDKTALFINYVVTLHMA